MELTPEQQKDKAKFREDQEKCLAEIEPILEKYNLDIVAVPYLRRIKPKKSNIVTP